MKRSHPFLTLLFGLAMATMLLTDLQAEDRIWAALVLATNETPPKPTPEPLSNFAPDLQKIFGYNSFYVLGEKRKRICENTEEWIVPSKEVFLHLACVGQDVASYELTLDLYAHKKLVLTSRVKLARGAPLYIRGPQWGRGQLIYILEIR